MKKNISTIDRIIRVIIAAVLATLYFANVIPGTIGLTLLVVAAVFAGTSFINFCPLYRAFGIRRWETMHTDKSSPTME